MMNLPSFEEVYICSQMQVDRYHELLREGENVSDDEVGGLEDAYESHRQVLELLQKMFEESFPNIKVMLSGALSYNQFSAYWRLLLKYPKLCKGIEWKIFTAFSEVMRKIQYKSPQEAFRKCLPEISALFATPVMVAYVWERCNQSTSLIFAFLRWLSSDLFSAEIGANLEKFYKAILDYSKGKEWTENQKLLVEMLKSH